MLLAIYGRIKSLNYKRSKKEKILKQTISPKGYLTIHLTEKGIKFSQRVNILIAETFIPNPENKPQVNHKNGIKTDNKACNLEWVTNSENQLHAYKKGLKKAPKGAKSKCAIAVSQYDKTGKFLKSYGSIMEASRKLNIKNSDISRCCKGKCNTVGGYIWRYKDTQ